MLDPDAIHRRITSGDPGAIRARGHDLDAIARRIDGAGDDIHAATGIPVWTGEGATAFQVRAASLLREARAPWVTLRTVGGALGSIADTYADTISSADEVISYWRNRAADMMPLLEDLLRSVVAHALLDLESTYGSSLAAVEATLNGEDPGDTGDVSEQTRDWLDRGKDASDDFYDRTGSSQGPLIPHTKATGSDSGLIPQGLGYDPGSGMLLQTYYRHDGESVLSIIDPATGQEVTSVNLGGSDPTGSADTPGHAGGVTVIGDQVVVSSDGKLYTYSMNEIQGASAGTTVDATEGSLGADPPPGSYVAQHNGLLYVGDYEHSTMHVYEPSGSGWAKKLDSTGNPIVYDTPANTQGVVVRDDEVIYSTSPNRYDDSHVIVRTHDGDELGSYAFPPMAEGVVEVDGRLITTYESGAEKYGPEGKSSFFPWQQGDADLRPSTHMSSTPLGALELEAEPTSMMRASGELRTPAAHLASAAAALGEVDVPASVFGEVPEAAGFAATVRSRVHDASADVSVTARGAERMADETEAAARRYRATDESVGSSMGRLNPWD